MKAHELKTWPEYFTSIDLGLKNFEIRENDRGFDEGDLLVLKEWNPHTKAYTGRIITAVVTFLLDDLSGFLKEGYVALGICVLVHADLSV